MMLDPIAIRKAWGLFHHSPRGHSAILRNPPPEAFRPMDQLDVPAFAHDGKGEIYPGQFEKDDAGIHYYHTRPKDDPRGPEFFMHGIDAAAHHLRRAVKEQLKDRLHLLPENFNPDNFNPVPFIDMTIELYNKNHESDAHQLAPFASNQWRKIRVGQYARDGVSSTREGTNRPSRTENGTKITTLTNMNHATNPNGRFVESYYLPFNAELRYILDDVLPQLGIDPKKLEGRLPFLQSNKPFVYANMTAPPKSIHSQKDDPGSSTVDHLSHPYPDEYAPSMDSAHTWEVLHHLPDIFFRPVGGKRAVHLEKLAGEYIAEALQQGLDHVPNVPVTIDVPTEGGRMQMGMRDAMENPTYRQALIKSVSKVPAMMFLFGRSSQGPFVKLFNDVQETLEGDGIGYEGQLGHVKQGSSSKGQAGTHVRGAEVLALARAMGEGEEGKSALSQVPFSGDEQMQETIARNRRTIEALADHQASARGHEIRLGLGEIPSELAAQRMYENYPTADPETGQMPLGQDLDPHMEAYFHGMNYAGYSPVPTQQEVPASAPVPASAHPSATVPPPTSGPSPPPLADAGAPQPLSAEFQAIRPDIGRYSPAQFREMLDLAGRGRQRPVTSPELSPVEARAQAGLSDPRQTLLTQFMRSEDVHLPVMDQVMKALERMQYREAELDNNVVKHLSSSRTSSRQLASYVGLTSEEVTNIHHTMGDWHKIAKSYNVQPEVVKVIKMSMR